MGAIHGHQGVLLAGGSAPDLRSVIKWNPSDKNAAITLSGGNLIATASGGSAWCVVRADTPLNVKSYFEVSVYNASGTGTGIGIASLLASLSAGIGSDNYASDINQGDGYVYRNATGYLPSGYPGPWSSGTHIIGVYYDPGTGSNGTVGYCIDGVQYGLGNSLLPSGYYPAICIHTGVSSGAILTGKFKASDLTYSPPTGYVAAGI